MRPGSRAAAVLGALAIGAGIGLMATSGYLISRAAQQPPILELSVAIVAVRFFGVSRAVLRYLERLAGHDATLRALGTIRARLFARLEPLVPGRPAGRADGRPALAGSWPTSTSSRTCGCGPPARWRWPCSPARWPWAIAAVALPAAALVLAAALAHRRGRAAGRRPARRPVRLRREAPGPGPAHGRAGRGARLRARARRLRRGRTAAAARVDACDRALQPPPPPHGARLGRAPRAP